MVHGRMIFTVSNTDERMCLEIPSTRRVLVTNFLFGSNVITHNGLEWEGKFINLVSTRR